MIVEEGNVRRPESKQARLALGWTSLHSWIFLAIVAVGLLMVGIQNRYHYLSPFGLGKAYRIDKIFGGIQEFDPNQGWVTAQLQIPPQMSMAEQGSRMQMPGMMNPPAMPPDAATPPSTARANAPAYAEKEPSPEPAPIPQTKKPPKELTQEEKYKAFMTEFPEYGKEEFQLANDDLYPDWKQNVSPNGTWQDFLNTYREFVQWWADSGSPPEPGFKLWKTFTNKKK